MEKSKPGLPASFLKRILPVLWLVLSAVSFGPSPKPPWWEVHFALTVRGEYTVKGREMASAGEFSYRVRWEGTAESDGLDFLLYHVKTDIQEWVIRERDTLPNATRIVTEKDTPEKPRLHVNYILREDGDLRFDFDLEGILIPLGASLEKFDLVLPCSKEHVREGTAYNEFIIKGSNNIAVGADGLDKETQEKSFSWEWRRQQWIAGEAGTAFVSRFHRAGVVATLIRHN
jgi:hypothetical protein